MPLPHEVTQLLIEWSDGDQGALDKLAPLIDHELHQIAHRYMRKERNSNTLQTTALINEAYLRLIDQSQVRWQNRAHFFALAAQMMRHIMVDRARSRHRVKRGGVGVQRVSLDEAMMVSDERATEVVMLDDALKALALVDKRKSQVVELRFFGGLSVEETAEALKTSPNTVTRDWSFAKAWLRREIGKGSRDDA